MEKAISEIKGLARQVFDINGFAGRITTNGGGSMLIWSRGLIPKVIAKIVPDIDKIYVMSKRYEEKAKEFRNQYQSRFLPEGKSATLEISYD